MKKLMMLPFEMLKSSAQVALGLMAIGAVIGIPLIFALTVSGLVGLALITYGIHHDTASAVGGFLWVILMTGGIIVTRDWMFGDSEVVEVKRGIGVTESKQKEPEQKRARGLVGKAVWYVHTFMVEGYCYMSLYVMSAFIVFILAGVASAIAAGPLNLSGNDVWKCAGGGALIGLLIHGYFHYQISKSYNFVKLPPWETGEEEWV